MKTTLMLISTFLFILTGCGDSKTNPPTQNTDKISKIIIDRTGNSAAINHLGENIVSSQELFEVAISDLKNIAHKITANNDKNQVLSWIKALKDENVDFTKDNILIYTFEDEVRCDYKENTTLTNHKQIDIIFTQTREECDLAITFYYLAYKVSKDIEKVSIKAFEEEVVLIDM